MHYHRNAELIQRLAAEFVLGTLRGAARLRFQRLAREHATVRDAVREWEQRLMPMAEAVPEATPPRRVWRAIAARTIDRTEDRAGGDSKRFWDSLAFWRNWGLIATGCAAALLVAVAIRQPQQPVQNAQVAAPTYVATLKDSAGNVALIALVERNSTQLQVRRVALKDITPQQVYELWALPRDKAGAPRSLGLIPAEERATMQLAALATQNLRDAPALAISLEPAGGSKTGLPTGPVLYSGPVVQF